MSTRHATISDTGSSGAGAASVRKTVEPIFRREKINAASIAGDAFHRDDRVAMKQAMADAAAAGKPRFGHLGPEADHFEKLGATFAAYIKSGGGETRRYVRDAADAALCGSPPGTFTDWRPFEQGTDLHFNQGLHGAVVGETVNVAPHADLESGVVPVINLQWIQKIRRDRDTRGYSTEAVTETILRRMPDFAHKIVPQFTGTDSNFQRNPTVDSSNRSVARPPTNRWW